MQIAMSFWNENQTKLTCGQLQAQWDLLASGQTSNLKR